MPTFIKNRTEIEQMQNKEHVSQVAPGVPQELQNEIKIEPKVTKLRPKGFEMEPKIYQNLSQEEPKKVDAPKASL